MRTLPILLSLLLPTLAAVGEPPLLEDLQNALGADATTLRRLESLRTVAECTGPRGPFTTEVVSARPLRVDFHQRSERGHAHYRLDRLGPKVWQGEAKGWLDGPEGLRGFIRGHEFHLMLFELESRFQEMQESGTDAVGGQPCRKLTMKTPGGLPASLCLAEATHLPVALSFVPAEGEAPIQIVYEDWKEIGELRFFQAFTLTQGEEIFTYRYTTVEPTLTPSGADPAAALDWTVGAWQGVRRDGGEGTPAAEAPMTLRVEPLFSGPVEGNGQLQRLEIGEYRGVASQLYDPELPPGGRWVRQYANPVHRRFVRLEGEVYGPRSVWQRPQQSGERRSVLESERLPDGHWLRTMYRSEDGGASWRILWQDELHPAP